MGLGDQPYLSMARSHDPPGGTGEPESQQMKAKYQIRFNHRSSMVAPSMTEALRIVRSEGGVRRLAKSDCSDGTYCWRSKSDQSGDDGSRSFAVICGPGQQEE